jgi:Tfp pilus assembly protein FimV
LEQQSARVDELIDEYLYGELPEDDRRKLGEMLRSGPVQERKLRLAEDLRAYANGVVSASPEPAPVERVEGKAWWRALLDSLRFRSPVLAFALALALLLSIFGGGLMYFKARRLEEQLARQPTAPAGEQELRRQLEQQSARVDELTARLQQAEEQSARLNEEMAALKSQGPTPQNVNNRSPLPTAPVVASIFLPLTQGRSTGAGRTLNLAPGTPSARLTLDLDVVDPAAYKSFKADVYETDGPLVESRSGLSARKGGGGNHIDLNLPARVFKAGEYRVALNGLTADGRQEPIGVYHFSVRTSTR